MKKLIFIGILGMFFLSSCHNNEAQHNHEGHDHSEHDHSKHDHSEHDHAEHDHAEEGHNHETKITQESHFDEIIFPEERAKAAGVLSETIQPKTFQQVIPTSGQVLAAQGDETTVVANVAGIVSFKSPVTDGMAIRKGMPLVILSSKEMLDGNPVQRAKVDYEIARKNYERAKELLESQIISEKEFNDTKQVYENTRISYEAVAKNQTANGQVVTAPIEGYVKSCIVSEGDYVTVGQPLISITQNRRLFLRAEVSEKYYNYLKSITSANFETPYNNKVYSLNELNGKILSYGKASGGSSFYVPVTFEFDNRSDIIPGAYVSVYLLSSPMENVLALPRTALTEEQGLYFIYLQLDAEGYQKQEVTLGADNGKEIQILSGLKAGDRVVTKGAYQVKLAGATNAIPAHSHEH